MDVEINAEGQDAADQLRALEEWLADVDELTGRVVGRESLHVTGTLGPAMDALVVALGPGGAATALATAVIAWLRTRRREVRIKLTLSDRSSLELSVKGVADLDANAVRRQVDDVAGMLRPVEGADGRTERREIR